jgi:hypothetical protein
MADDETHYLLDRAKEEAVAAIQADHPLAEAAHQQLSILYSTRAIIEIAEAEEATSECGRAGLSTGGHVE